MMETTLTPAEIEALTDMVLERFHTAFEENVTTDREDNEDVEISKDSDSV